MKTRKEAEYMSKVILDGEIRFAIEKAKRAAAVDYSYTCFKGKTHVKKEDANKCMWLAQEKKEEPYV